MSLKRLLWFGRVLLTVLSMFVLHRCVALTTRGYAPRSQMKLKQFTLQDEHDIDLFSLEHGFRRRRLQTSSTISMSLEVDLNLPEAEAGSISTIRCEGLLPMEHLCPIDANVRIEYYTAEGKEISHGHSCSTFADPSFECVVTVTENGVQGFKANNVTQTVTDFMVNKCEPDGDVECVYLNDGEHMPLCTYADPTIVALDKLHGLATETSFSRHLLSEPSVYPVNVTQVPYLRRELTRLEPWTNCYGEMDVLSSFDIGISIGSSLFSSKVIGNNLQQALKWIEAIVADTNVIYSQQLKVKLVVQHIQVVDSSAAGVKAWDNPGCESDIYDQLEQYTTAKDLDQSDQGLWHLFDDCYGQQKPIGVAYRGVLCHDTYNTGVSHLFSYSKTWLTFAHEIGHNFGAKHSFEEGQGTTGGLMDYGDKLLDTGTAEYQFNQQYREGEICEEIRASQGACPEFWTQSGEGGVCGNGVIEAGEACECNIGEVVCPCCEHCQLRADSHAQCDPIHNECCHANCRFKDTSGTCSTSAGEGYCRNGFCTTPDCKAYGLGNFCGLHEDNSCKFKCKHSGTCTPMNGWTSGNSPINVIRSGARCLMVGLSSMGVCENGQCVSDEHDSEPSKPLGDDQYEYEAVQSELCCEEARSQYGQQNFLTKSSLYPNVCGDVSWTGQRCAKESFETVRAVCAAHGLRMCHLDEVIGKVIKGAGCNMYRKQVWTSTPCQEGSLHGYLAAKGKDGSSATCRSPEENFSVACCADEC